MATPNMLTPGTILQGRYRVVRQLARGGMGTVYEAVDERLDAVVALKETSFDGEELRRQFEREARLLARLHHPALPRVSDHFGEGAGAFLVMQFVEGSDLETLRRARPEGSFPVAEVLEWADQLLDALDYLHVQQPPVIHRDIKPQNLKLGARGRVMLLDFGLAKGYASRTSPDVPPPSVRGGTLAYSSLEQLEGTGTDALSDLFSLAVTLYQLMTGVLPPAVMTRLNAIHNKQPDPLRPAHEVSPHVPVEVSAVLRRAMAVARDERPASAAEMRRELQEAKRRHDSAGAASTILMPSTVPDAPAQGTAEDEPPFDSEAQMQAKVNSLTGRQKHHLDYWTAFRNYVEQHGSLVTPPNPQTDYWAYFSVGRGGFALIAYNGMRDKWIGVELLLSGPDAKSHFHLLSREREQIEREIGTPLEWQEKPSQKTSAVTLKRPNVDPTKRQDWPQQHEWLLDKLEAFHKAFEPRVKNLRASNYVPGADVKTPHAESISPEWAERFQSITVRPSDSTTTRTRKRNALLFGGLAALMLLGLVGFGLYKLSQSRTAGVSTQRPETARGPDAPAQKQATNVVADMKMWQGHTRPVSTVAFAPDGGVVASGSTDGTVRIWDAQKGKTIKRIERPGGVTGVAFSPDGTTLAVAGYDSNHTEVVFIETRDWSVDPKRPKLDGLHDQTTALVFAPDDKLVGTVGTQVKIWNLRTGSYEWVFEVGPNPVFAVSPDGAMVATANSDENAVKLWDTSNGKLKRVLGGHTKEPLALAFALDEGTLASGDDDTIILWDAQTGAPKQTIKRGGGGTLLSLAFAPDGGLLASGGGAIILWDARTGEAKQTLQTPYYTAVIESLAFSRDGKRLAGGASDGALHLFDLNR